MCKEAYIVDQGVTRRIMALSRSTRKIAILATCQPTSTIARDWSSRQLLQHVTFGDHLLCTSVYVALHDNNINVTAGRKEGPGPAGLGLSAS